MQTHSPSLAPFDTALSKVIRSQKLSIGLKVVNIASSFEVVESNHLIV
jgi:hypothetical protein